MAILSTAGLMTDREAAPPVGGEVLAVVW